MKTLFKYFPQRRRHKYVTVISGLPRSGTSMMMKMLAAGGLPPLTDNQRIADHDNPKGYYEYEIVKKLPDGDTSWLKNAQGMSIKVISALLEYLPPAYTYRVLFMQRNVDEILASQKQMLVRSGKPADQVSDQQLAEIYGKHLSKVSVWLDQQANFSVLYVDYTAILLDPEKFAHQINQFLDNALDEVEMAKVVDPTLYRQRK